MKYHNVKVKVNGETFDSRKEANRYCELKLMQRAGKITDLKRQVSYLLIPAQYDHGGNLMERAVNYKADFVYQKDGELVVEDTKGVKTDVYIIKRKLMLFMYGIRVVET